jgi:trigger factor
LKVSVEQSGDCQAILNIEVEPEELETSEEASYRRLVKKVSVPGFRKGKAPRAMLERYIGKDTFREDVLEHLIPDICARAIEEQGIKAFAAPEIELVQSDPVIIKATVPTPPIVELGDYRHMRLTREDPQEITQEEVDAVIERLRHQNALWEPVERSAQFGDMVTIDASGTANGEPLLNEKGQVYWVQKDSALPLPGFAEQLVGMKKGQQKEFNLSYPDDYHIKKLAGKEYLLQVALSEIKEEKLPELDDEFAKGVNADVDSLSALREQILANLKALSEENTNKEFQNTVVETVVSQARVEFPPILVEREVEHLLEERARQFGGGERGLSVYLQSTGKSEDELREELSPIAAEIVSRSLVLSEVTEKEGIEVSPEKIDHEIENMVKNRRQGAEEWRELFQLPEVRSSVERMLLGSKTVQYLTEVASGEKETEASSEEGQVLPV